MLTSSTSSCTGSSTESQEQSGSKRKLPSSFHKGASGARQDFTKTAAQLKAEGAKAPEFYKAGVSAFGSSKTSVGKVFLSKEQRVVHERVVQGGKNMFFTGSAGTGKSVVLREIIKDLRKKFSSKPDAVAVTASTGIAACNIGGVTLHSFAGCGLGIEPVEALVGKIKKNRKGASRWMRTVALVIDEGVLGGRIVRSIRVPIDTLHVQPVSMVDPDFLDKLNSIGQLLRKSPKPFGGIQVIMTGDFFQLPPVNKFSKATRYAFDADCWDSVVGDKVCLTQVFRQKDPGELENELKSTVRRKRPMITDED
jgi:ATP-dependent DNA helicase PIF1